jgi:autotransporter-associated beta strand protein
MASSSYKLSARRRALVLAAASAAPVFAWAVGPADEWDAVDRSKKAAVWTPNQGLNLRYVGSGVGGLPPSSILASSATQNVPSIRNQQFIVFGDNPNLTVPPPSTTPLEFLSWNNASNWTPAVVPTGGGTATLAALNTPSGVDSSGFSRSMILDTNVALSGVTWTGTGGEDIHYLDLNHQSGSPTSIDNSGTGLTFSQSGYDYEAPGGQAVLSTTFLLNNVYANISGSGSVTVNTRPVSGWGPGKTFTGGVTATNSTFAAWALAATIGALEGQDTPNDSIFGTGSLTLNNGSFQTVDIRQVVGSPTISRQINLVAGTTNNIWINQGGTLSSVISGGSGGTLTLGKPLFGGQIAFTGASTASSTVQFIGSGNVTLRDGGTWANVPALEVSGGSDNGTTGVITQPLQLGASDSASANRLSDTADLRLNGSMLNVQAGTAPYNETVGSITLAEGYTTVTLQGSGSGSANLTGALVRQNRAGMYVRGANLGSGAATSSGAMFLSNGTSLLVGGGGAAGTTNQSIIPFVFAVKGGVTANTANGTGSATLVTYDANGVRPLDVGTELKSGFGGAAATDNVRVTNNSTITGTQTVNSVVLNTNSLGGTGGPTVSGGTLQPTSGVILNATQGSQISSNINFGSAEGVIITASAGSGVNNPTTNGLNISGVISGSNGLTKIGQGNLYLTGANTYTGQTTITAGRVFLSSDVANDGITPGPFGLSTTPIVLTAPSAQAQNTGGGQARLLIDPVTAGTPTTINFARSIVITGKGTAGTTIGSFVGSTTFNLTGDLTLNTLPQTSNFLGGTVIISGNVSGPGILQDLGATSTLIRLTGNNSGWTGGAVMSGNASSTATDIWEVGSDTALGTGPVQIDGFTVLRAINGSRTLGNNFYTNPAGESLIMFDGPLKLTGAIHLGNTIVGGNVDGSGTLLSGFSVGAGQTVEFSGNVGDGAFSLVSSTQAASNLNAGNGTFAAGGTLVLSGNNSTFDRLFVGAAGYGDTTDPLNGNAPVPHINGLPGGTLKLASNGALGQSGVQVEWDGSTVVLANNITTPVDNGFFLRPGNGVGGIGELYSEAGTNNSIGGNIVLVPAETGTTTLTTNTIGVGTNSTLTHNGLISDYSHENDGTTNVIITPGTAGLAKVGAGTLVVQNLRDNVVIGAPVDPGNLASVTINAGTIAVAQRGTSGNVAGTSRVKSLTIATGASLNLNNNTLLVDYDTTSPLADIKAKLTSGYAAGLWTGTGINSSTAASQAASTHKTALGYGEITSTATPTAAGGFSGLDSTNVVVRYTYSGDANLDGKVDTLDFNALAGNFGGTGKVWTQADFNFDGTVDTLDFNFLASNFGQQIASDGGGGGASIGALVPEPTSVTLLGVAAVGLMARRRRRQA